MMVDACAYFQPPSWRGSSPDLPKTDPRLEKGRQLLKLGKYKESIAEFEAVLKKTPGNPVAAAQLKLAQKEMAQDRERAILSLIQLHEKGLQHYHQEEYVRAGNAWKEALHLYGERNDPTIEREIPFQLEEMANDLKRTLHLLVEQGVFLYRQGKLQMAVATWEDILKIEPQHAEAKDFIQKAKLKIDTLEKLTSSPDSKIR
ncbi:MAG: hypothetical protein WAO55_10870 [Candidatus Manganitrophaceae bacterium]